MKKGDHWALMANFWEKKRQQMCKKLDDVWQSNIKKSWQFNFSPVYSCHSSDFVTLWLILLPYPFTCFIFDNNTLNFLRRKDLRKNIFFYLDTIRSWGPATKKPKAILYNTILPYLKGWRYPIALLRLICFTLNFTESFRKKKVSNLSQYTLTTTYMAAGYFFS